MNAQCSSTKFIAYTDSVETIQPDEEKTFDELADVMHKISMLMNDRYRHAVRSVHSKSHGLLKADLRVLPNLPAHLAQGLFAKPATYPTVIRFSTTPGDILADSVSTPRGMAIKVIGVDGPVVAGHAGNVTQDFIFVDGKSFGVPDAKAFIKLQKLILANADDPELFKKFISNVARGGNAVLGLVGAQSASLEQLGALETHILGQTYGTTAALRYGDYVCKMSVDPASENLKSLAGKHVGVNFHFSGLRDAVVDFFKTQTAEWDVCIQLSTDLQKMPVEDPSVPWDEKISPYVPVAKLIAGPQDAYSPARRVYFDELLSFNPFHCLEAHRPLGNVMRARRKAYAMSSKFRHEMNQRPEGEPKSIDEVPA